MSQIKKLQQQIDECNKNIEKNRTEYFYYKSQFDNKLKNKKTLFILLGSSLVVGFLLTFTKMHKLFSKFRSSNLYRNIEKIGAMSYLVRRRIATVARLLV